MQHHFNTNIISIQSKPTYNKTTAIYSLLDTSMKWLTAKSNENLLKIFSKHDTIPPIYPHVFRLTRLKSHDGLVLIVHYLQVQHFFTYFNIQKAMYFIIYICSKISHQKYAGSYITTHKWHTWHYLSAYVKFGRRYMYLLIYMVYVL